MFHYINGTVAHLEPNFVVIDCGGVGYGLCVSPYTVSQLRAGEMRKLFVYEVIREDCFDLYGFESMAEKRSFEMLLGVSGVGPRAALSILSATTPESLAVAIISENEKTITAAQGVGKKLAQRVILELKDKMAKQAGEFSQFSGAGSAASSATSSALSDATAALTVLGYGAAEISAALKGAELSGCDAEEIIKMCLKQLMK